MATSVIPGDIVTRMKADKATTYTVAELRSSLDDVLVYGTNDDPEVGSNSILVKASDLRKMGSVGPNTIWRIA